MLVASIVSWLVILVFFSWPHVEVRTESRRNLAPSAASRLGQGPKSKSTQEHLGASYIFVKLYKSVIQIAINNVYNDLVVNISISHVDTIQANSLQFLVCFLLTSQAAASYRLMTSVLPGTENPSTGGWSRRGWFTLRGWCPTCSVEMGFPWFPTTTIWPLKRKNRLIESFWHLAGSLSLNPKKDVKTIQYTQIVSMASEWCAEAQTYLQHSSKWYYLESDKFKQPRNCWCIFLAFL